MRDLRRYAWQTSARLLVGFIAILFIIGIGLIWFFYGREAALLGLVCLIGGLAPLALIGISLVLIEWIVRRANR
jgi:hypothetical protein